MTNGETRRFKGLLMAACAAVTVVPATGYAQTNASQVGYNIPAQDLGTALTELARQSNREIYFSADLTRGKRAPRISGKMKFERALDRLLGGSGLSYEVRNGGAIVIRASSQSRSVGDGASASSPADDVAESRSSAGEASPEIIVTGSRTLNLDVVRTEDDTRPYVVIGSEEIERSGAPDVETLLRRRLSMNGNPSSDAQKIGGNTSLINLRGLGANNTLILVDGHRTAAFGVSGTLQQPDLNGIPVSAIERIEVLPATASGIYGGNAVGGVINIILKRDYAGFYAKAGISGTTGGGGFGWRLDAGGSFTIKGPGTRVSLSVSRATSNPLQVGDRDLQDRGRALTMARNASFYTTAGTPPLGRTTNIRSTSGAPLVLKSGVALNSPITFVPTGYAGIASDGGLAFVANAGSYNLAGAETAQYSGGNLASLINNAEVTSANVSIRQPVTSTLEGYLELGYSTNTGHFYTNQASSTFVIPTTSAANPFQQDIRVTTPAFGADSDYLSRNRNLRAVGGLIYKVSPNWTLQTDYTWTRATTSVVSPGGLTGQASTAVSTGTINVLRDTNLNPIDFSPYLTAPTVFQPTDGTLSEVSARLSGKLFSLPGGAVRLTSLVSRRVETLSDQRQDIPASSISIINPARKQRVNSVYVEAIVPIIGKSNAGPLGQELELQLAGRYDDYRSVGANQILVIGGTPNATAQTAINRFHSFDPSIGLRYRPVDGLMFRASYGTGFLPPALNQFVPSAPRSISAASAAADGFTDPKRGNEVLGAYTLRGGGNPNLGPERSKSWSAGIVLEPAAIPNLRFSADWTRITKHNAITIFTLAQSTIALEDYVPGLIERGAPSGGFSVGPITAISTAWQNASLLKAEAIDFNLDYSFDAGSWGRFDLAGNATYQIHNIQQASALAPVVENVGRSFALPWKGTASVTWTKSAFSLTWSTTYYDGYYLNQSHTVAPSQGSARIPSQTYSDIFVSFDLSKERGVLANTRIVASMNNVFNVRPPVDTVTLNFGSLYSPLGDPRLRTFALSLEKRF